MTEDVTDLSKSVWPSAGQSVEKLEAKLIYNGETGQVIYDDNQIDMETKEQFIRSAAAKTRLKNCEG